MRAFNQGHFVQGCHVLSDTWNHLFSRRSDFDLYRTRRGRIGNDKSGLFRYKGTANRSLENSLEATLAAGCVGFAGRNRVRGLSSAGQRGPETRTDRAS